MCVLLPNLNGQTRARKSFSAPDRFGKAVFGLHIISKSNIFLKHSVGSNVIDYTPELEVVMGGVIPTTHCTNFNRELTLPLGYPLNNHKEHIIPHVCF